MQIVTGGIGEILMGPEIALGGDEGSMAKGDRQLIQFRSPLVGELGVGAAQIMRRDRPLNGTVSLAVAGPVRMSAARTLNPYNRCLIFIVCSFLLRARHFSCLEAAASLNSSNTPLRGFGSGSKTVQISLISVMPMRLTITSLALR